MLFSSNNMFGQANLLNAKNPLEVGDSSSSKAIVEFMDYEYVDDKDILWSKSGKNLTINVCKPNNYSPALFLKNLKNSESGDKTIEVSDSPIAAR